MGRELKNDELFSGFLKIFKKQQQKNNRFDEKF